MANSVKGEAALKLSDGREYVIVMDMEGLVEAESAYGKPLQALMQDAGQGFVGATRALLYGALRAKHPGLTKRDALEILQSDGEAVADALTAAVEASFPEAKANGEGGDEPHPPGKPSGASGVKKG